MDTRLPLDGRAIGLMLLLCLTWGLQQSVLKLVAQDITPLMHIALRSGISAVLVGLFMVWRREGLGLGSGTWRPGLLVGVLFALEFLLLGQALRLTSASHSVVFLYSAPIFVALGLHFRLPAERLNRVQWGGIALAFMGIVLTFLGGGSSASAQVALPAHGLWGDVLALLAGMAWGATTVVVRCSSLARASASQTLLYQLVAAGVLLVGAAVVLGQAHINPTAQVWTALAFQSIVVSFISFLVWFWLLRHYLASQLGVFSFVTPLFGVAFGIVLLHEPLELRFVLGAMLVLAGVVLVTNHAWFQAWRFWRRYQN